MIWIHRWLMVCAGTLAIGVSTTCSQDLLRLYEPLLPAAVRDSVSLASMARTNIEMYAAIHPELISYYIAMLQLRFCDHDEVSALTAGRRLRDLKYAYLEQRRDWALHELHLLTQDVNEYSLVEKGRSVVDEMLSFPPPAFVGPLMAQADDPDPIRPGFRDSVIAMFYESRGLHRTGVHGDAASRRVLAEDAIRQRFLSLSRHFEGRQEDTERYPSSVMTEYASLWYVIDRTTLQDSLRFLSRYLTYRYAGDRPGSSFGISFGGLYLSSPVFSRSIGLSPPVSYSIDAKARFDRWMYMIGTAYAFTLRDALVPLNRLRVSASYAWATGDGRQPADEIVANSIQPAASFTMMEATVHSVSTLQMSTTIPLWYPIDAVSLFAGGSLGLVRARYSLAYNYVYATIAPDSSKTYHAVSGESSDQSQWGFRLEPLIGVDVQCGEHCAVVLTASLRRASLELAWYP